MKKCFLLIVFFVASMLLFSSCSNDIGCDCCGNRLDWNDAYILTSCYYDDSRELYCSLCKSCYQDAMHILVDDFEGSILEEYLLEHLIDNFPGRKLEEHLVGLGYIIDYK